MKRVMRSVLLIAVIYLVGSYYFDRPDQVKKDAVAVREMTEKLPEPEQVAASVRATQDRAGETLSRARQRLDSVRTKVQGSIARGSERFTGAE